MGALKKKKRRSSKKFVLLTVIALVVASITLTMLFTNVISSAVNETTSVLLGLIPVAAEEGAYNGVISSTSSVFGVNHFADKQRDAVTVQQQFCRDLAAGRVPVPASESSGSSKPLKIKQLMIDAAKLTGIDTIPSFPMTLYDGSDVVSGFVEGGGWEEGKIRSFAHIIQKYTKDHNMAVSDLTFVDIGANVGWFTLLMASTGVNVIAFEPMKQNHYVLGKTLCNPANKDLAERVTLFRTGLSNETATCLMYSENINVGDGVTKCVPDPASFKPPPGYIVRGMIEVDRLDNILDTNRHHIVAVKMDTEGSEAHVVAGGPKFFFQSQIDMLVTEFMPHGMMLDRGGDPVAFVRSFLDAGYGLVSPTPGVYYSREAALNMNNFPNGADLAFKYIRPSAQQQQQ